MRTLYRSFIFVTFTFFFVSLYIQLSWWRLRVGDVDAKNVVVAERFFETDITNARNISSVRLMIPVKTIDETSLTNSMTLLATNEPGIKRGWESVWNTSSDNDRILEQMKYVPKSFKKSSAPNSQKRKIILVSDNPERWGKHRGQLTFLKDKCLINNCFLVGKDYTESVDAILFGQGLFGISMHVRNTRENTIKIFFALESPKAAGTYNNINNYINWTATYRRDSTIVSPYEKFSLFPNASDVIRQNKLSPKNYASGKTRMAAIFVSNCGGYNERMRAVHELQKYVKVDVFGFCGKLVCPRTIASECFKMLKKTYKFYLAFENANCRDYITEKFFVNGLQNDVIPVVMGAHPDDYKKVAPPHSYIHIEDFPSVQSLAAYMTKLDNNDDLYNEYFLWKGTGSFINTKFWCRLCALLNDDNKPTLVVENLSKWWQPNNMCRSDRWLL